MLTEHKIRYEAAIPSFLPPSLLTRLLTRHLRTYLEKGLGAYLEKGLSPESSSMRSM
jgi:hypothetical protein